MITFYQLFIFLILIALGSCSKRASSQEESDPDYLLKEPGFVQYLFFGEPTEEYSLEDIDLVLERSPHRLQYNQLGEWLWDHVYVPKGISETFHSTEMIEHILRFPSQEHLKYFYSYPPGPLRDALFENGRRLGLHTPKVCLEMMRSVHFFCFDAVYARDLNSILEYLIQSGANLDDLRDHFQNQLYNMGDALLYVLPANYVKIVGEVDATLARTCPPKFCTIDKAWMHYKDYPVPVRIAALTRCPEMAFHSQDPTSTSFNMQEMEAIVEGLLTQTRPLNMNSMLWRDFAANIKFLFTQTGNSNLIGFFTKCETISTSTSTSVNEARFNPELPDELCKYLGLTNYCQVNKAFRHSKIHGGLMNAVNFYRIMAKPFVKNSCRSGLMRENPMVRFPGHLRLMPDWMTKSIEEFMSSVYEQDLDFAMSVAPARLECMYKMYTQKARQSMLTDLNPEPSQVQKHVILTLLFRLEPFTCIHQKDHFKMLDSIAYLFYPKYVMQACKLLHLDISKLVLAAQDDCALMDWIVEYYGELDADPTDSKSVLRIFKCEAATSQFLRYAAKILLDGQQKHSYYLKRRVFAVLSKQSTSFGLDRTLTFSNEQPLDPADYKALSLSCKMHRLALNPELIKLDNHPRLVEFLLARSLESSNAEGLLLAINNLDDPLSIVSRMHIDWHFVVKAGGVEPDKLFDILQRTWEWLPDADRRYLATHLEPKFKSRETRHCKLTWWAHPLHVYRTHALARNMAPHINTLIGKLLSGQEEDKDSSINCSSRAFIKIEGQGYLLPDDTTDALMAALIWACQYYDKQVWSIECVTDPSCGQVRISTYGLRPDVRDYLRKV